MIKIAQLVSFLILARMLSPSEFGWFGIMTTAVSVAALLGSLGLRASFGYEIGQKHRTAAEAAGTALALWLPLTCLTALCVWLLYGRQLPSLSALESGAIIFVSVAGSLLIILMQGIFLGRGDIRVFALSETMPGLILAFLTVGLASFSLATLRTALWAYSASFVIAAPIIVWLALNGLGRLGMNVRQLGRSVRYGSVYAVNLVLTTISARLSMFVIEYYRGPAPAGEFFAAIRLNEMILEAATVVGVVLFSNAARQEKGTSVLKRNARISTWMFWLFMCLGLFIALIAPFLVEAIAGVDYPAAAPALQIMALCMAPTAASKVIYQTLSGSGNARFGTPVIFASLATNLAVAFALVPEMGVNGAALALVAGRYVLFMGYLVSCRKRYDVRARDLLLPRRQDARTLWRSMLSMLKRKQ